jgi:hypothetical protein
MKKKYRTMTKKKKKRGCKHKLELEPNLTLIVKKDHSSTSFGTFKLNQLDKRRGKSSAIGFIKPYKRK